MSNIATLLCALLLLAVNDKKSAPPVPATQGAGGWAIISQGAAVQMQGNGPWYFDFPSNGGVGYVYKPTGPLWAGQTITLRFAIQGDGTLSPADPADVPPTTVRLFIWRAGDNGTGAGQYEFYRWWSGVTQMPGAGEYTVQFPIDGRWTSIFAKSGDMVPGSFADALQNAGYVGFTMSGQYFAGHGVRANGPARFVLKEFTVN